MGALRKHSFNLVIERLLISGGELILSTIHVARFNLVIERLLISGDDGVLG